MGIAVGKLVSVLVGVNNSAPKEVGVGVKVRGVGVEVAKRFCVGMGVSLMNAVGVLVGGVDVCVASNDGRLIPEQPVRKMAIIKTRMNFFMMRPLHPSERAQGLRTVQCVRDTSVRETTERPSTRWVTVDATS